MRPVLREATLTTAGNSTLRTITVTAKTGSLSNTVAVQVVNASASSGGVQMGSMVGGTFSAGIMAVGNTGTLSAGGSTSLQVNLQKADGSLFLTSTDVTFSSQCIAQGLATVSSPGHHDDRYCSRRRTSRRAVLART